MKNMSKLKHQVKSNKYYIFWGAATIAVMAGQIFVGAGYQSMSQSENDLTEIIEININSERNFCWEIFCDAGWVLLSGVNSGYGGEGPHGSSKILIELGFTPSNEDDKVILDSIFSKENIKIDCRKRHDCKW